jgi:p-hydroxybenzoate 3-monooxygenase
VTRGTALEISIAPLRSYVFEPMQYGRLFLAGDSAHIVPPTGAKGVNLAASDVAYLAEEFVSFFTLRDEVALAGYGARALARIWKAERFSWYLTKLMHRFPEIGPFERRMQIAELAYLASSRDANRHRRELCRAATLGPLSSRADRCDS